MNEPCLYSKRNTVFGGSDIKVEFDTGDSEDTGGVFWLKGDSDGLGVGVDDGLGVGVDDEGLYVGVGADDGLGLGVIVGEPLLFAVLVAWNMAIKIARHFGKYVVSSS
jgi:hypothetical protein